MPNRLRTVILISFLALLHLALLFAGFFAPYDFAQQHRDLPFAPPTRLHLVDAAGTWHAWPFVHSLRANVDGSDGYTEDVAQAYPLRLFVRGNAFQIVGPWTAHVHLFGVASPGQIFLFGTDDFGRDELSRMLFGGRISLFAGILGATAALSVGAFLGVLSGFYSGWTDAVIMRTSELFLALPWLYLLFAVRAILPLRVKTTDAFLLFIVVVGLVAWARPARLVRGIVLSARERHFALAARAMGASNFHVLRYHILPEIYVLLLTTAALLIPQFVLAEVTLSFLGLGVGEPIPTWGNLLIPMQKYSVLRSYWWLCLPAFALVLLFLAYHWASTTLQAALGEVRS
jgi:peptide/nickel transport system permease protein